jgi:hypothetical protein
MGGTIEIEINDFHISKTSAEKRAESEALAISNAEKDSSEGTSGSGKIIAPVEPSTTPVDASATSGKIIAPVEPSVTPVDASATSGKNTAPVEPSATPKEKEEEQQEAPVATIPPLPPVPEGRKLDEAGVIEYRTGFIMRKELSESSGQQEIEKMLEHHECFLDHVKDDDVVIDMSDPALWKHNSFIAYIDTPKAVGMYNLLFTRCSPTGPHFVSFKMHAKFYNPGPNYLSAGEAALPELYLAFFAIFAIGLICWCYTLLKTDGVVHRIHYMMTALMTLKVLSLLSESIRYHYIAISGASLWSAVYLAFAFMKGVMLFTVILLIGSGWSLMKSYLNDKEKKMVFFVLVLQVLDNVAMVVMEESTPGSQNWQTWQTVLHTVDIICCVAILMPIVWSIRHLRQAAEVDGKAQNNLMKLQLFRQFYVTVVIYIYFTRIVVYLLEKTLPFYLLWFGPMAAESAAVAFYFITGYKFRPALDNPYLPVSSEGGEGREYGLEEDDEEDGGLELQISGRNSSYKY